MVDKFVRIANAIAYHFNWAATAGSTFAKSGDYVSLFWDSKLARMTIGTSPSCCASA